MALIGIVFVWEYHINLRTFEDLNYYIMIPSVRSNALRAIRGARILSFLGKLLVSDGFAEAMPDVSKYDD